MKKWHYYALWSLAVLAFCSFLYFLLDVSYAERISKIETIWQSYCGDYLYAKNYQICFANADIFMIFLSLGIFGLSTLILFQKYNWWVLILPVLSFIFYIPLVVSYQFIKFLVLT